MNHKLKRLWCGALRGGTWTQQKNAYESSKDPFARCALGVLAEVAEPGHEPLTSSKVIIRLREEGAVTYGEVYEVFRQNDEDGKSFNEIADWIEKNL